MFSLSGYVCLRHTWRAHNLSLRFMRSPYGAGDVGSVQMILDLCLRLFLHDELSYTSLLMVWRSYVVDVSLGTSMLGSVTVYVH